MWGRARQQRRQQRPTTRMSQVPPATRSLLCIIRSSIPLMHRWPYTRGAIFSYVKNTTCTQYTMAIYGIRVRNLEPTDTMITLSKCCFKPNPINACSLRSIIIQNIRKRIRTLSGFTGGMLHPSDLKRPPTTLPYGFVYLIKLWYNYDDVWVPLHHRESCAAHVN